MASQLGIYHYLPLKILFFHTTSFTFFRLHICYHTRFSININFTQHQLHTTSTSHNIFTVSPWTVITMAKKNSKTNKKQNGKANKGRNQSEEHEPAQES